MSKKTKETCDERLARLKAARKAERELLNEEALKLEAYCEGWAFKGDNGLRKFSSDVQSEITGSGSRWG